MSTQFRIVALYECMPRSHLYKLPRHIVLEQSISYKVSKPGDYDHFWNHQGEGRLFKSESGMMAAVYG